MVCDDDTLNDLREDLRRFIERRVGDAAAAEDLVQEVLLRAVEHRDALPTPEALRHWSFRVAANAVVDHYRRRPAPAGLQDSPGATSVPVAAEAGEAGRGLASCVSRMVEALPDSYRRAVELVELKDMTQQQAAGVLGLSLSGAKSRVQRGRAELRRMLLDCCDVQLDGRGGVLDYDETEKSERYCGGKNVCVHSAGPSSPGVKGRDGRGRGDDEREEYEHDSAD